MLPKRRKDFLRRARLLDQIHQNMERKLTFISAPAGYGKTSLLVDFASDVEAVICWYHISVGDEDLRQFARYLIAAFRQKFKGFGDELEDSFLMSGNTLDPKNLGIAILNEIIAKVDDFCLLFLDDYHIVGECIPVVEFIETLLEHLPDQLRLVIASRSEYGIPTMQLYVRNHISILGKDILRFEAAEIIELVRLNFHYPLPFDRAEQLAARSDGWVVAIHLSLQSEFGNQTWKLEGAPAEQVYRFLAEDVVQKEKTELRTFMQATAILDEFTEPLANYLLEIPTSQLFIQELDKRNLFLVSIEMQEGVSYRYHQLFLEFLRDQLEHDDPAQKMLLHRRAASWFHHKKDWERAIAHKLMAGDRLEAAAWMDEVAKDYYVVGGMKLIHQWVAALASQPDVRQAAPILLLNQAKVLINQGDYENGIELLDLSEPVLREKGDIDQIVNLLITKATLLKEKGKFTQALKILEEVQNILVRDA